MRAPTPLTTARWLLDGTLIVLVAVVFSALVVARLLPAVDHETVTITGRSMEPTIPLGSAVVLDRVAPDGVAVGDIVTVTVPERAITFTHRVVELVDRADGRWLRTKGDANEAIDPALVRADWVVGRVGATMPGVGFLLQLLAMPSGMLAVIGLALTLFLSARLIEELEWEVDDERRPVAPAFPSPAQAHAAAASVVVPAGPPSAPSAHRRSTATTGGPAKAAIRARTAARWRAADRADRS